MKARVTVSSPVQRSARVLQVGSMFDVPIEEKASLSWDVDLPLDDRPWSVGLIAGPSGSGKTTIAWHLWPDQVLTGFEWSSDRSLLDDFPAGMGIKEVTGLLNSVGLASPPSWLRPYGTLSNGEAFRASIARALAETDKLTVIDEFTSVVDRQVAKVASHTVQKTIRRTDRQLVAITCHYDVVDWLQPDWIYDVAAGDFAWRSVQPHPELELKIYKVDRSVWRVFRRHHYLTSEIHTGAVCYAGFIGDDLVAFTSYLHFPHAKTRNIKMGHRLVVLPDYQGLGLGGRLDNWLGQYLHERGYRYHNTVAHPALIRFYSGSPRWRLIGTNPTLHTAPSKVGTGRKKGQLDPRRLGTYSFAYVPEKSA